MRTTNVTSTRTAPTIPAVTRVAVSPAFVETANSAQVRRVPVISYQSRQLENVNKYSRFVFRNIYNLRRIKVYVCNNITTTSPNYTSPEFIAIIYSCKFMFM